MLDEEACLIFLFDINLMYILQMVYVLSVYNKKDKYNRVTVRDLSLSSLFLSQTKGFMSYTSWRFSQIIPYIFL